MKCFQIFNFLSVIFHFSDYENIFLQILQIILEPFIYMWLCIICGTSSEKKICIKWFLVSLFAFKIVRSFISWIWYWILSKENEDSYFHFSHDTLLIVNWSMRSGCRFSCYTWNIILQDILLWRQNIFHRKYFIIRFRHTRTLGSNFSKAFGK